jgi:NDP-sugar pyrophosphorylase family protein
MMNNSRKTSSPNRAVILAAGRGSRLRPCTDDRPKPLLTIGGYTLLDYIFRALRQVGVEEVCMVTGYLSSQIEEYVADGSKWSLHITYRNQSPLLGTAHALKTATDFIISSCFVLAADYKLTPNYLVKLKNAYIKSGCDMAVSLKEVPLCEASSRSSVRLDKKFHVKEIIEKPALGSVHGTIAASLIYIFPQAIRTYLDNLYMSERGEYELQTIVNQMIIDGHRMIGYLQSPPAELRCPRWGQRQI